MTAEREELAELVRSLRAHVVAHGDAGTTGFPAADRTVAPATQAAPAPSVRVEAHVVQSPLARSLPPTPPRAITTRIDAPLVIPGDRDDRVARLNVLATEVAACTRCVLHETRTQTVFARGNPQSELCFVGEGPGADEDAQGLPFVGKAGQLLDKMIVAMGYRPEDVYICNVVKCRPPGNRKPEPDEMRSCLPYLQEQLALVEPKVIVALGGTAAEGLIGAPVAITRLRGQWRLYRGSIPLMPTFHPAYLLRTPEAKREAWADLRAVLDRLGRPVPARGGGAS